jgi:VIT1/CCC1 family predicted Fe2+/Mn2+ transporter
LNAPVVTMEDRHMSSPATNEFPQMGAHPDEPHAESFGGKLNALRAGVLGANDGIVSVAGLVMGVAGATTSRETILVAGLAGLVAGALSMAAGEYVSVSTQRDT